MGVLEAAVLGIPGRPHVALAAALADSGSVQGTALVATAQAVTAKACEYFQSPPGAAGEGPASTEEEGPIRC